MLKARLQLIKSGRVEEVIQEAKKIQKVISKPRTAKNKKVRIWITQARQLVQEGETNRAIRLLEKEPLGLEIPSVDTFNRMQALFPRRRNTSEPPKPNTNETKLSHFRPQEIHAVINDLQGGGGPSHLSAREFKRWIHSLTFRAEATRII